MAFSQNKHDHGTRQVSRGYVTIPQPRTNALERTAMYRTLTQWNKLQHTITQATSKENFKKQLKATICNFFI